MPDGVPAPVRADDGRVGPPVPWGRRVALPGRGSLFVREVPGPPGAPTLVLLHGWMGSAGLNWFRTFETLGSEFRVLAPDLRGHSRGLRARRFRLEDCADDVAALCGALGISEIVAAGYSMGGPVAQLLWRRHPELVQGLVLCATSDEFGPGFASSRLVQGAMRTFAAGASLVEAGLGLPAAAARRALGTRRPGDFVEWAIAELNRHSVAMLTDAARSVSAYRAGPWLSRIDVPTAVVVTTRDHAVAPKAQLEMAGAIPFATVHPIDGGHSVCVRERFAEPLLDACSTVVTRAN